MIRKNAFECLIIYYHIQSTVKKNLPETVVARTTNILMMGAVFGKVNARDSNFAKIQYCVISSIKYEKVGVFHYRINARNIVSLELIKDTYIIKYISETF